MGLGGRRAMSHEPSVQPWRSFTPGKQQRSEGSRRGQQEDEIFDGECFERGEKCVSFGSFWWQFLGSGVDDLLPGGSTGTRPKPAGSLPLSQLQQTDTQTSTLYTSQLRPDRPPPPPLLCQDGSRPPLCDALFMFQQGCITFVLLIVEEKNSFSFLPILTYHPPVIAAVQARPISLFSSIYQCCFHVSIWWFSGNVMSTKSWD